MYMSAQTSVHMSTHMPVHLSIHIVRTGSKLGPVSNVVFLAHFRGMPTATVEG